MKALVVEVTAVADANKVLDLRDESGTVIEFPQEWLPHAKVGEHYRINLQKIDLQKIDPEQEQPRGHYVNEGCESRFVPD